MRWDPANADGRRIAPVGLADEVRVVLRRRGSCGVTCACLARRPRPPFSPQETQFVQRLAPYLAEGIRMGLLCRACELEDPGDGPGPVLLDASGALAGMNDAAGRWIEALGGGADGSDLPVEISALAVRLRQLVPGESASPRLPVRTAAGRWAMLRPPGRTLSTTARSR